MPSEHGEEVRALLMGTARVLEPPPPAAPACRDPDDDRILALALAFGADVLVTGDEDLLVLNPWNGIPIVRPREFWVIDRVGGG